MITGNLILLVNTTDTQSGRKRVQSNFQLYIGKFDVIKTKVPRLPRAAVIIREAESPLPEDEAHEDADAEPDHRHGEAQARHAAHGVGGAQ